MKNYGLAFVFMVLLALAACSSPETPAFQTQPPPATVSGESPTLAVPTTSPSAPGVTLQQVLNAEYELGASNQSRTIQLTNGEYQDGQGPDLVSVSLTDYVVFGDLDGDGLNEGAAIIAESYGGTGVFVFLALYAEQEDQPVFLTSVYVDDRPQINGIAIDNGEIYVDATVHTAEDPMCCPTQPSVRHYRLFDKRLVLSDYGTQTPAGQLRMIKIESPVDGADVSGIIRISGSVSVAPFENNLVYRIYDLGGLEVVAGAIAVSAPDLGAAGTFDRPIDVTAIPKGTTIRLVIQDVNSADGSLFAMDSVVLVVR